jgi:Collagen triple helix repeat (20 copies)
MMQEDNTTASALELRIKRITRYMTIGISGLLVLCVLLFFYIGSIRQSEQTSRTNTQIQATETLQSDICKVYPNQEVCIIAKKIKENPTETIVPKDGDKGDKGDPGRGVTTFDIKDGQLVVSYSDGTTETVGQVVGKDGKDAAKAINGKDGRGILSTSVTGGALEVRYTDGTTENLGIIVGPEGKPGATGATGASGQPGKDGVDGKPGIDGKDGQNGTNGVDGISVTNVSVDTAGTVSVSYSDGRTEIAGKIIVNTITAMTCNQETDTLSITVSDGSVFSATVDCSPDKLPNLGP